jgi:hypothetical protein
MIGVVLQQPPPLQDRGFVLAAPFEQKREFTTRRNIRRVQIQRIP